MSAAEEASLTPDLLVQLRYHVAQIEKLRVAAAERRKKRAVARLRAAHKAGRSAS